MQVGESGEGRGHKPVIRIEMWRRRSHGAAQRTPPACGPRSLHLAPVRLRLICPPFRGVRAPGSGFGASAASSTTGDAAIVLADQTVPLLKDAMDWAHEAEQGRGSGVYEGRLGAGFLRLTALNAVWLSESPCLHPLPTTVAAAGWSP